MTKRKDIILKMLKNTNGCRLKQILKGYDLKFLLNLIGNRKDSEVREFYHIKFAFLLMIKLSLNSL